MGIVGDGDDLDQRMQMGVFGQFDELPVERDLTLRRIAAAAYQVVAGTGDDVAGGHLVLGQGAGLVRADDGDRAQRFNRGQAAGDRLALCHALHAKRQRDGEDGRQPFGNGGDGEADGGEQDFAKREAVESDADHQHQSGKADDEHRQLPAELRHLPGQRCLQGFHFGDQAVDATDFSAGAGGDDDPECPAGGDQGAGIGHAGAVADAGVGGDRVNALVAGQRFAGQCRFLDAQVGRFQQTEVGRDAVARFQADDVAGYQFGSVDLPPFPLAPELGARRQHLADAGQRRLSLAFLEETDDRVDDDDAENDPGVDPVVEHGGDYRGADQDEDQDVLEMLGKALEEAVAGWHGQAVGAVRGESAGCLVIVQAGARGLQTGQYLGGGLGMEVGGSGRRHWPSCGAGLLAGAVGGQGADDLYAVDVGLLVSRFDVIDVGLVFGGDRGGVDETQAELLRRWFLDADGQAAAGVLFARLDLEMHPFLDRHGDAVADAGGAEVEFAAQEGVVALEQGAGLEAGQEGQRMVNPLQQSFPDLAAVQRNDQRIAGIVDDDQVFEVHAQMVASSHAT